MDAMLKSSSNNNYQQLLLLAFVLQVYVTSSVTRKNLIIKSLCYNRVEGFTSLSEPEVALTFLIDNITSTSFH